MAGRILVVTSAAQEQGRLTARGRDRTQSRVAYRPHPVGVHAALGDGHSVQALTGHRLDRIAPDLSDRGRHVDSFPAVAGHPRLVGVERREERTYIVGLLRAESNA
jgi:hypothetical protein